VTGSNAIILTVRLASNDKYYIVGDRVAVTRLRDNPMYDVVKPFRFAVIRPDEVDHLCIFKSSAINRFWNGHRGNFQMFAYPESDTTTFGRSQIYLQFEHDVLAYPAKTHEEQRDIAWLLGTVFCAALQGAALGWNILRRNVKFQGVRRHEIDLRDIVADEHLQYTAKELIGSMGDYRDHCRWDILRYGVKVYREKGFGYTWSLDEFLQSGFVTFPYTPEMCDGVATDLSMERLLEFVEPNYELNPQIVASIQRSVTVFEKSWIRRLRVLGERKGWLELQPVNAKTETKIVPDDQRNVFVVHGRDETSRKSIYSFLRSIGLHPMEWSEAVTLTKKGTPSIGDILDAVFEKAQAVVVLMTPEEEVRLLPDFIRPDDALHEREVARQPRPNVLFEAGIAMGRYPNRTVLLQLGEIRSFSDIRGLHIIRMNNSLKRRQEFAQRLENAGCPVNLKGTDWQSTGEFPDTG